MEKLKVQLHDELVATHDGAEFNTIMKALENFHQDVLSDDFTQQVTKALNQSLDNLGRACDFAEKESDRAG